MNSLRLTNLVIIILTQFLCAYYLVEVDTYNQSEALKLLLVTGTTILAAISGNLINDFYDWEVDLINNKRRWKGEQVTLQKMAMVFAIFSLIVSFWLSVSTIILAAINLILLFLYSKKYKGMPVIGNVVVSFLTASVLLIMGFEYGLNVEIISFSVFAFIITFLRELTKDIEDIDGDTQMELKTLPILLGTETSKFILYILAFLTCTSPWLFFLGTLDKSFLLTASLNTFGFIIIIFRIHSAKNTEDYHRLSTIIKIVMLAGIGTMVFY